MSTARRRKKAAKRTIKPPFYWMPEIVVIFGIEEFPAFLIDGRLVPVQAWNARLRHGLPTTTEFTVEWPLIQASELSKGRYEVTRNGICRMEKLPPAWKRALRSVRRGRAGMS